MKPATYGYGGNYATTTYGAQGGADGGGFVAGYGGGSQSGSQDTPGGMKVCQLIIPYLPALTISQDLRKRYSATRNHQANIRCVSLS